MPKISVIVPVYNTEKYLRRCMESILNQTFNDFEIILIDDGSTDNSHAVCNQYAKKDSRVRVIPTNHIGVGAVRNLGLLEAKGNYIMFCDSDDYVEPKWIEELYSSAQKHPNSLVNCDYAEAVPSESLVIIKTLKDATKSQIIDKIHYFPMAMHGAALHLWTRIFKTEIIRCNCLEFRTDMHQGEDIVFITEYLTYCNSFYYTKNCLYFWTDNDVDTLSRAYCPHCFEDVKTVFLARKPLIDERYRQYFYDDALERMMQCISIVFDDRNTESEREKKHYCQKIFHDSVFRETVKNASEKACSRKKRFVLLTGNFRLFNFLRNIKRKNRRN